MPQPLVSILTPFKNTARFLPECLQSIQNQSYSNWELIIVDDHSKDDSFQIVEGFARKDDRIQLIKNSGIGIIDALRSALECSNGDYFTRMDSDDIMTPDKLEVLLNCLLQHGKQHIAIGMVNYFSAEGIGDGFARYETWLNKLTKTGANFSEIYKECVIPSPCWMVHRDTLMRCDAFNPTRYPEDYDLAFRFYKHNIQCIPNSNVLHHWRDYRTRTSRTHEHYAQNYFLDLKMHYFLELDFDPKRTLTVWGAGYKGKRIATLLQQKNVPFIWICDNPKKIGKQIYDMELHGFNYLETIKHPQSIVTVANKCAQVEISSYFKTQQMIPMVDYFFFC